MMNDFLIVLTVFTMIFVWIAGAEAKLPALGSSVEGGNQAENVIKENLNTMTAFSNHQRFGVGPEGHSAQF